jgi:hypothetical protein
VPAAGDIDGRNERDKFRVRAVGINAKALAEVRVEVDPYCHSRLPSAVQTTAEKVFSYPDCTMRHGKNQPRRKHEPREKAF